MRIVGIEAALQRLDIDAGSVMLRALMQGGAELEGALKEQSRVKTGNLRGSWHTRADRDIPNPRVIVGTTVEYAPYVGGRGQATGYKYAGVDYAKQVSSEQKDRILAIVEMELRREMGR